MPIFLGVSKPILDNVIFCHQEESNWPLSEPAVLKKKFDDIFAATKYTKALECLKTLRKSQTAQIQLDAQQRDFLKSNKDKAVRVKTQAEIIEDRIRGSAEKIERLTIVVDETGAKYLLAVNEFQQFQQLDARIVTLRREKDMLVRQQGDIKRTLTLFTGIDHCDRF